MLSYNYFCTTSFIFVQVIFFLSVGKNMNDKYVNIDKYSYFHFKIVHRFCRTCLSWNEEEKEKEGKSEKDEILILFFPID